MAAVWIGPVAQAIAKRQLCVSPSSSVLRKGVAAVGITYFVVRSTAAFLLKRKNNQKIAAKRQEVAARKQQLARKLEVDGELLTPARCSILELDIVDVVEMMRTGKLRPVEVLEAYQAKMLEVDGRLNAVCDVILEAEQWAKQLEDIPVEERGPLFGLPISVKECFLTEGYDATIGFAKLIGVPAKADGPFVKGLKDLHAIPFCLTNIPQTMASWSCSNPVYGNTANAHDPSRTAGGSSGGEGALIAAGGSLLGIGSDIGGSVRIPAHFNGIAALKVTNGRIYEAGRRAGPGVGAASFRMGLYGTSGFMSKSVDGLVLGMRALLQTPEKMSREDWRVAPVPWREQVFGMTRKLKIGWYDQDGYWPATPGCSRAVRDTVALLQKDGHIVEKVNPPPAAQIWKTFLDFNDADGGAVYMKSYVGETFDESMSFSMLRFRMPKMIKKLLLPLIWLVSKKIYLGWTSGKELSRDLWAVNATKDRIIYEFMDAWEQGGYDVLLCPGFPFPAPPPQYCSTIVSAVSYTAVYNLLGCPSGAVPVTRETKEDQIELDNYPVATDYCHRLAARATRGAEGMPIGIQVVGRHWQEEMVLNVMARIQKLVASQNGNQ